MELKTNPGGIIPIAGILGRDQLSQSAWAILESQSLIIAAERRTGKTSLLRKMAHESPPGWFIVSRDLESVHSASEFATAVYEDVERNLSKWKRTAKRSRKLLSSLGGMEVGGVLKLPAMQQTPWKHLLAESVEDLLHEEKESRLVFFWDEMPFMLQNISAREGESIAMEILDVLRSLRQEHALFRMVLTGSVGLHHVLSSLKEHGYSSAPVNDMYEIEVPPLEDADARQLAQALIEGEKLSTEELDVTLHTLAVESDRVPFYIHHIIRHLKISQSKATPVTVAETVLGQLRDANDPWSLGHYRDRIATYYPGIEKLVMVVLDILALAPKPLKTDDVLKRVASTIVFDDRDRLLKLLRLLERDHYLVRSEHGFAWKFSLIARWWRLDRDLPEPEA